MLARKIGVEREDERVIVLQLFSVRLERELLHVPAFEAEDLVESVAEGERSAILIEYVVLDI